MMINIVYYTMTGHSKKIAKAIGKELGIIPEDIKTNPKLENTDLLYIVSGIYGNKSSPELIKYVKKLTKKQVKEVVFITSSGAKTTKPTEAREILESNGIKVFKDDFVCPGGFMFFGGHPNNEEIISAIEFAKKLSR